MYRNSAGVWFLLVAIYLAVVVNVLVIFISRSYKINKVINIKLMAQ
jgi:hypothetical protein